MNIPTGCGNLLSGSLVRPNKSLYGLEQALHDLRKVCLWS